jgi:hypothetical protein
VTDCADQAAGFRRQVRGLVGFRRRDQQGNWTDRMDIKAAFARDGFSVVDEVTLLTGKRGYLAESDSAINHNTGKKKTAIYVEGNAYEMGFLVGALAEAQVAEMTGKFIDNILPDFIDPELPQWIIDVVGTILEDIVSNYAKRVGPTVPDSYKFEMHGIEAGCQHVNPSTTVSYDALWTLNTGFDVICAWAYAPAAYWEAAIQDMKGRGVIDAAFEFERKHLRVPLMCNGFCVFGSGTVEGIHYFGRDFQFPTAEVFQNLATLIIYNPSDGRLPLVSTAAPGFSGSMTAMNIEGIAAGVDMAPAGPNNPAQPGMNSLLLVRDAVHRGSSAESAAEIMVQAERGVTWAYLIGDGKNDRAVVVEAGKATPNLNSLSYPPLDLLGLLPSQEFLDAHAPGEGQNGAVLRWNDYKYPDTFLQFNEALFRHFGKPYRADVWGPRGFIDASFRDTNAPEFYYFCPQREEHDDLLIVTNQFVTPQMRLCQMAPWSSLISEKYWNDVPWRYDALNDLLQGAFGSIDSDKAWTIINFLSPTIGKYPDYYVFHKSRVITYIGPDGKTHETTEVHGCVSLCDLSRKTMKSLYGYYADLPIEITLPNYVDR